MNPQVESNRLKSLAGKELKEFLKSSFQELINQNIILDYQTERSFNHKGYQYKKQYLINFLIETLDNKFILINSSKSFRSDRVKQQQYDINGVLNNSKISSDVIASIMLYPDSEINNSSFISYRKKIKDGEMYSSASHLLILSEFYEFLESHKASVESKLEEKVIIEDLDNQLKDGSYYGKAGNALEKEVVRILNDNNYLSEYKSGTCVDKIFQNVMSQLCNNRLNKDDIVSITATNTVEKLAKGGNAKTDVIININTIDGQIIETLSIKRSSQRVVSCHDYKVADYVRVLDISGSKLEEYFKLFQKYPSYSGFEKELFDGYSSKEFEEMLTPYSQKFTEWALTGKHDDENLRNSSKQVSRYLLIVNKDDVFCSNFKSYIEKLYENVSLKYGVPFSWTYPSKQRGKRIQLKMPILKLNEL